MLAYIFGKTALYSILSLEDQVWSLLKTDRDGIPGFRMAKQTKAPSQKRANGPRPMGPMVLRVRASGAQTTHSGATQVEMASETPAVLLRICLFLGALASDLDPHEAGGGLKSQKHPPRFGRCAWVRLWTPTKTFNDTRSQKERQAQGICWLDVCRVEQDVFNEMCKHVGLWRNKSGVHLSTWVRLTLPD